MSLEQIGLPGDAVRAGTYDELLAQKAAELAEVQCRVDEMQAEGFERAFDMACPVIVPDGEAVPLRGPTAQERMLLNERNFGIVTELLNQFHIDEHDVWFGPPSQSFSYIDLGLEEAEVRAVWVRLPVRNL